MCVKVGNKIDGGKQLPTGSRVHEKSERVSRASCEEREWPKKKVSMMQSLCRSLYLLDSVRCLIAVRGRSKGLRAGRKGSDHI